MSESNIPIEYKHPLVVQLETTIDLYAQARERYWQALLEGPDWAEWSRRKDLLSDADEIANLLRKRTVALRNIGDITEINRIHDLYVDAADRAAERHPQWPELESAIRTHYSRREADEVLAGLKEMWSDPEDGRPGDPIPLCVA